MQLNKLQAEIADILLDAPDRLNNHDLGNVFQSGKIPLRERLNVYRNNVIGNVGNALIAQFPLLEKLVGKEFLSVMVRHYILQKPPQTGCLTFYGEDFDQFVADYAPAKNLPYLSDMAKFEILMNKSYHAKDDEPLTVQELSAVPDEQLGHLNLRLCANIHLMSSEWPVLALRDFCRDESLPAPNLQTGRGAVIIYRKNLAVEAAVLSEMEYFFLTRLQTQLLGQSVADTLQKYPDFDFQKALQRFMNQEIFLKSGTA